MCCSPGCDSIDEDYCLEDDLGSTPARGAGESRQSLGTQQGVVILLDSGLVFIVCIRMFLIPMSFSRLQLRT